MVGVKIKTPKKVYFLSVKVLMIQRSVDIGRSGSKVRGLTPCFRRVKRITEKLDFHQRFVARKGTR